MRQPVRPAASRAFWPSRPMARLSWSSGTITVAWRPSSSTSTSRTRAGLQRLGDEPGGLVVVRDDVDLLAAQLGHDHAHARAARARTTRRGAGSAAARARAVLYDPARRLPEMDEETHRQAALTAEKFALSSTRSGRRKPPPGSGAFQSSPQSVRSTVRELETDPLVALRIDCPSRRTCPRASRAS